MDPGGILSLPLRLKRPRNSAVLGRIRDRFTRSINESGAGFEGLLVVVVLLVLVGGATTEAEVDVGKMTESEKG